ncbi:hypothetical protein FC753_04205 [Clostridium botulinum]|uniref:hypothetical protein n=1 Tax=Clostridium botulinum TaxID=1491 RepID=UPI0013F0B3B9|nr:hypothetical protein [Clostridium botulinum]MCS6110727.1 hypothetical protein [Clostridium botulinum]NFE11257.1 hypothetical protein [Clostridium botulinum]
MKQKQYIIKNYGVKKEVKEIMLTNSFGMELYLQFKKIKSKNNKTNIDNIIKIMLPSDEEQALEILQNGYIDENGKKFLPLATTTGFMKKEELSEGIIARKDGCCEYLFISEEDKEFVNLFDNVVSCGKIQEKLNKDTMQINKDIISRISLAFSTTNKISYYWKDKVVILPETTYKYAREYVTLDKEALRDGEIELNEPKAIEVEHTAFDGFGLASPEFCDMLSEKYGYKIDYFGLRMYPTATKGLCVRFPFVKYFEDNFKEKNDVFWKDKNGDFYTLDRWGNKVNISKCSLILNETQCKWAKWYSSMDEIYEAIDREEYKEYKDLFYSVYIARVNKKELEEYTRMNYQLLNVTNLTINEVEQLTSYDKEMYESMICKKDRNIDRIKIFMGDMSKGDDEGLRASTKVQYLMQQNDRFYKTKFAKETVARNLEKYTNELCSGKFHVKGNYKTLACCPITYCKWIMSGKPTTEIKEGLQERQFYVSNEYGKRVLARNPLASFHEPQKIELIEHGSLKKYLGVDYSTEIIFFNMQDDTAKLLSGADMDLDEGFCIDDETIYNSIIKTTPFLNVDDGATGAEMLFTLNNMYQSILASSGNTIGKIASLTAKINTYNQDLGFIRVEDGKVLTGRELYNKMMDKKREHYEILFKDDFESITNNKETIKKYSEELNKPDVSKERKAVCYTMLRASNSKISEIYENMKDIKWNDFLEILSKFTEDGKLIDVRELPEEEIKEYLNKRFNENAKYIYYALYLNQKAIDAVKTLNSVTNNEIELLKEYFIEYKKDKNGNILMIEQKDKEGNIKTDKYGQPKMIKAVSVNHVKSYPYFMKFTKEYVSDYKVEDINRSALTINAKRIEESLLARIHYIEENLSDNNSAVMESLKPSKEKADSMVKTKISSVYNRYKFDGKVSKNTKDKNKLNERWNAFDKYAVEELAEFENPDFIEDKAIALKKLNISSKFAIRLFFDVLKHYLDLENNNVYSYEQVNKKTDIEFMHRYFIKKQDKCQDNSLHEDFIHEVKNEFKVRVGSYTGVTITDEMYVSNKHLYRSVDNTEVGFIFNDCYEKLNLTDGQVLKVIESKVASNSKSVSLIVE